MNLELVSSIVGLIFPSGEAGEFHDLALRLALVGGLVGGTTAVARHACHSKCAVVHLPALLSSRSYLLRVALQ